MYEDLKDRIGVPNELITKDCIYDEQLFRNTVRKFQLDNNLQCDGALGRKTLAALGYSEEEIEALMLFTLHIIKNMLDCIGGISQKLRNEKDI